MTFAFNLQNKLYLNQYQLLYECRPLFMKSSFEVIEEKKEVKVLRGNLKVKLE